MSTILQKIIEYKRDEVALKKKLTAESHLFSSQYFDKTVISMSNAISKSEDFGIIAEFKRKSPSKSDINIDADASNVTLDYQTNGASALSILTDKTFFGGSDEDLIKIRSKIFLPILRKDFIIDPYQILESKAIGADCILLIAEVLTKSQIFELSKLAHEVGLEIIMELHTADQIYKGNDYINIYGVNNRDLKTFEVDISKSKKTFDLLPESSIKIAESGLDHLSAILELFSKGYQGFLIGEYFMKSGEAGALLQKTIKTLHYDNKGMRDQ